jgi:hypothetical protein
MTLPDPRALVEAPVRRELGWLVIRGISLVGVVAALAVLPAVARLDVPTRDGLPALATLVLLGYTAGSHLQRVVRGRVPEDERASAWDRASEVDASDALLARWVAWWVPVALFVALGLSLWPHMTDPNPALACAWVVLALPPVAVAWLIACSTWQDACRDGLARAGSESQARFRRYWSNPGR